MAAPSRHQFLAAGLRAVASGALAAWAAPLAGCRASTRGVEATVPLGQDANAPHLRPDFEPAYLALHRSGELAGRADALWAMMDGCTLCPRQCGARRLDGERGFCGASSQLRVSSYHPHFGEERPLVGRGGSGTIFFTHCNLRCVFCINWPINHAGEGTDRSVNELAGMMLALQRQGCHNLNVVTPTHYSPHIVRALDVAAGRGLRLPVVYNTSGWERLDVLRLLDGVVDIYLPDFKYAEPAMSKRYSSDAESYPAVTREALLEMHRQVGVARAGPDGLMYRGLMIRHLVLPNRVSGTQAVTAWIGEHLPKDTYVNVMSQYRPAHRAADYPALSRRLTRGEYQEAVGWAREAGLTRLDVQGWRW